MDNQWYIEQGEKVSDRFSFTKEHYIKNKKLNVLNTYYTDKVTYLKEVVGIEEEEAKKFVSNLIRERKKVPTLTYYERDDKTKDKVIKTKALDRYLEDVFNKDEIIVPSFTKYNKYDFSLDSQWTIDKVNERNTYKKKKQKAEQDGDPILTKTYDNFQKTKKTGANSLSGLCALKNVPIHTFSIHYSLTSITRVSTSSTNQLGERMFGGNRNWLSEEDAIEDLILHHRYFVKEDMELMQERFKLKVPTKEMVREYVFDKVIGWEHEDFKIGLTLLQSYINNKTDLERVFIFYAMDFVTTFHYNQDFANMFLEEFTRRPIEHGASKDMSIVKNASYNIKNMLYTINNEFIVKTTLDMDTYKNTPLGDVFIATYKNIMIMLEKYEPYIKALFKNVECTPRRLGKVKFMIKNASVLSDTDSTCPTALGVLKKQIDPIVLSPYNLKIMAPLIFFFSEKTLHSLQTFTSLTNAKPSNYDKISMKAEYIWSVFAPASKAKHYTTITHQKEFFVLDKGEIGSSGVHLIAGKMSPELKELYSNFKEETMREIEFYGKLNLKSIIKRASSIEARVVQKLLKDPRSILPLEMIKPAEEYSNFISKGVKGTPAFHKEMYTKHYAKLFNGVQPSVLPALYAKVFIKKLSNRYAPHKEINELLGMKEGEEFINPLEAFKLEKKNPPSSIRIPLEVLDKVGLPDEWLNNIDILETINKAFSGFYNYLASLGLSKSDDQYFSQAYSC